jgi:inosose dehydratase
MGLWFGSSPDSWGVWFPENDAQPPWDRFLDELSDAGYRLTELGPYGYLPTDAQQLEDELGKRGLRLTAGTVFGDLHTPGDRPRLREDTRRVGRLAASLGATYLVLIPGFYRDILTGERVRTAELDNSEWAELITTANELGLLSKEEFDLQLVFHSHADATVEYASDVDRVLAYSEPESVALVLDTGHYEYRDGDSVELFRRSHDRIPYFHLKSVDAGVRKQVEAEDLAFGEAVKRGVMCEPQDGAVEFDRLAEVMDEIGYEGLAVVEQDMYPLESLERPREIAVRTREYFTGLGWTTEDPGA